GFPVIVFAAVRVASRPPTRTLLSLPPLPFFHGSACSLSLCTVAPSSASRTAAARVSPRSASRLLSSCPFRSSPPTGSVPVPLPLLRLCSDYTVRPFMVFVLVVFCDSFTAVCGFNFGFYPARFNSVKFDFGLLIYWPQVSQICVYSLVLDIKSDMVGIVNLCLVHLLPSLGYSLSQSRQSLIENEVIALVGLGSHSSVLRFFSSNYVALAHSFSAVCRVLYVCGLTVEVYVFFSNHWWQFGKKSYSICFLTLHQICLVSRRLGCSLSRYHDLTAFVAECLALLGISQLVCKSDCHELSRILSESWSSDVHWILLAIRSLILSFQDSHAWSFASSLGEKTMMISDLPHHLLEEILSRAPATTLRRLRPTCKQWNALLRPNTPLLLMLKEFRVCPVTVEIDLSVAAPSIEFKDPFDLKGSPSSSQQVNIVEVIHCKGETKWIQASSRHYKKKSSFALGYKNNKSCRDYKILRVTRVKTKLLSLKYMNLALTHGGERFGRLNLPPVLQPMMLSLFREEQISGLHMNYFPLKMDLWVTTNFGTEAAALSWSKSFTVDLHVLEERYPMFTTFLLDENKKVVVCLGLVGWDTKKVVYIIGEDDEYHTEIPYVRSTHKPWWPRIFNYVPSLVQIQQRTKQTRERRMKQENVMLVKKKRDFILREEKKTQ
ncbi:hypothetical protein HID58_043317, partial [Brassica napus]